MWQVVRRFCCVILIVSFSVSGMTADGTSSLEAGDSGGRWNLQDAQLKDLREKALDGDPEAVDRVAMHYSYLNRPAETAYWAQIGAENGNGLWMQGYAKLLYEEGGADNCRRAIFWLNRAASVRAFDRRSDAYDEEIAKIAGDKSRCGPG